MSAYEVVRTIDQKFGAIGSAGANRKRASAELKRLFERLRIPLAKLEPAPRHRMTDYPFPRPGIQDDRGIAWEVAPGEVFSRSYLSDQFLGLLMDASRNRPRSTPEPSVDQMHASKSSNRVQLRRWTTERRRP